MVKHKQWGLVDMGAVVTTNKLGQALGRKGLETRQRLMEAGRKVLKSNSPVEMTSVSIAKKAKSSAATFYIYFKDVRELLLALSEAAEADMDVVHTVLDEPWDLSRLDLDHSSRVVQAYISVWDKHRDVLRHRNLEADRGDAEFEDIRLRTTVRIIKRFTEHIYAGYLPDSGLTKRDAWAEASALVAAMERLGSADPAIVSRAVPAEVIWGGLTRVIARILQPQSAPAVLKAAAKKVATKASARRASDAP